MTLEEIAKRQVILARAIQEVIIWHLRTPKGNESIDGQYHDRYLSRAWHRITEEFGECDNLSGWISRSGWEEDVKDSQP